jgi:ABC-type branched-subunit amino acid transport system ATPase component
MTDAATPMTTTRPAIKVENVVKSFSGRVVVDIDNLVLGDVPIEGLIGPNGAGKTTLMRMVMHSTSLDRGTITLLPHDTLTILDSLLLSATTAKHERPFRVFDEDSVYAEAKAEVDRLVDYFGFGDPAAFSNSAGEKKLLDIMRCLLLKPRFLLLDEPTAGLPEEITTKVMSEVRSLAAKGTSVVIVEHNLDVIWNLCDEVHFMAEGKVLMRGTPQDIRAHRTVVEKYLGEGHV